MRMAAITLEKCMLLFSRLTLPAKAQPRLKRRLIRRLLSALIRYAFLTMCMNGRASACSHRYRASLLA